MVEEVPGDGVTGKERAEAFRGAKVSHVTFAYENEVILKDYSIDLKLTMTAMEIMSLSKTAKVMSFAMHTLAAGVYLQEHPDRKSTRLNSSHWKQSRMPSSA